MCSDSTKAAYYEACKSTSLFRLLSLLSQATYYASLTKIVRCKRRMRIVFITAIHVYSLHKGYLFGTTIYMCSTQILFISRNDSFGII